MFNISVNSTQRLSNLRQLLKEKSFVPQYVQVEYIKLRWVRLKINDVNLSILIMQVLIPTPEIELDEGNMNNGGCDLKEGLRLSDIFAMPLESGHVHLTILYPEKGQCNAGN